MSYSFFTSAKLYISLVIALRRYDCAPRITDTISLFFSGLKNTGNVLTSIDTLLSNLESLLPLYIVEKIASSSAAVYDCIVRPNAAIKNALIVKLFFSQKARISSALTFI